MKSPENIIFYLNQEKRIVKPRHSNQTILEYLRTEENLTGTKEGCAEGDCGACTVVLVSLKNEQLEYKAVNSCILFLPTLNRKQLITVEHLANKEVLHPCQQNMIDKHGSQCGFCTPGFVMSLFAFYHATKPSDYSRELLEDSLVGNLCRCTGYRPIMEAGKSMMEKAPQDQFSLYEAMTIKKLKDLATAESPQINLENYKYFAPNSTEKLSQFYLKHPDALLLAGGTDLGLTVTKGRQTLPNLIYIGSISELQKIEKTATGDYKIFAGATLSQITKDLSDAFPGLTHLLKRFASLQIRNSATLVGNIANASPIGDLPPALIALNASIQLQRGTEIRSLSLESFFLDYKKTALQDSEFVLSVTLPSLPQNAYFRVYKITKRFDQDISAVCGAFYIQTDAGKITEARLGFGGVAAIPKRAHHVEKTLIGEQFVTFPHQKTLDAFQQDFTPLSDMRASANYRMKLSQNLLKRFFLEETQKNVNKISYSLRAN